MARNPSWARTGSRSRKAYCAWVSMMAKGVRNWCDASARNCDCSSSTRR
ncbi:Uncharacterised protein [Bordetella pertussis]|nr:Uncharacterised protein [Bordetella pertussis]